MTSDTKLVKVQRQTLQRLEEERIEQEKVGDILLLLENLIEREEATAKVILECLYDIGSVNLINKKVPSSSLRGILKAIARMSKPAFKIVALYWFKKNCPRLITDWLYSQVTF
ncbi:conserved hypothetical protein [Gloeothece citriformis PCC 7424]|uniref:Uncharacterized protein n=1 Tax=Gloeothece citriformis (strain PCC 7424) TaxID=65393 RepID=B7KIS8_GLOC7|nr:hypothetical protein [Gloeothece citriformis]ACK70764.1 conserved hypothetical protein [Gloeothece citriformis PCC 7424]